MTIGRAFRVGFGQTFNTFGRVTLGLIWLILGVGAVFSGTVPGTIEFAKRFGYLPFAMAFASIVPCVVVASYAAFTAWREGRRAS